MLIVIVANEKAISEGYGLYGLTLLLEKMVSRMVNLSMDFAKRESKWIVKDWLIWQCVIARLSRSWLL